MTHPLVTIRSMSPDDLPEVIDIHMQSFPGTRSTRLGSAFVRKLYIWYLTFQPGLSFVAVYNNTVVGFVTGTVGWGGGRRRFRFAIWEIMWSFMRHPSLLLSEGIFEKWDNFFKGLLYNQRNSTFTSQAFEEKITLDSIAVHPKARGMQIGQTLVVRFEQAAKTLGATYVALGVEYDNQPARRLYERCGWQLVKEDIINNSASYRKDM